MPYVFNGTKFVNSAAENSEDSDSSTDKKRDRDGDYSSDSGSDSSTDVDSEQERKLRRRERKREKKERKLAKKSRTSDSRDDKCIVSGNAAGVNPQRETPIMPSEIAPVNVPVLKKVGKLTVKVLADMCKEIQDKYAELYLKLDYLERRMCVN